MEYASVGQFLCSVGPFLWQAYYCAIINVCHNNVIYLWVNHSIWNQLLCARAAVEDNNPNQKMTWQRCTLGINISGEGYILKFIVRFSPSFQQFWNNFPNYHNGLTITYLKRIFFSCLWHVSSAVGNNVRLKTQTWCVFP